MKAFRLMWILFLLLSAVVVQLPAQQSEADRKLLAEIRARAEKGDALAQAALGEAFLKGAFGVVKEDVEAVKWFRSAAEQNIAEAQFYLGVCLKYGGTGVPSDDVEAMKWFRKAAEQNDAPAQHILGNYYASGKAVAKDEEEAVKWYRKAAAKNYAAAQASLGLCFYFGQGVETDRVEAVKWLRKAAVQNDTKAQITLGRCYFTGDGVEKDLAEAVKWIRKAAEHNLAIAQSSLGSFYRNGDGVTKDYVEAYTWWLLAAAQDDAFAKNSVTTLEDVMTREQIAEGQKLARNFKSLKMPSAGSDSSGAHILQTRPESSGTGFLITEDGFLVTNEHVVKDTTQVRLVTSMGLIAANVVKVDAANDLALLKAEGRFAALPVAASRVVKLGGTVATVGFPNIGLQGFAPKLAKGEIASLSGAGDDARYFQISVPVQPGMLEFKL
ncbi:MAG TPA: tetratricopeptide repeat-containing serine protease family protein [Verrucomicrobiae bacterium]|nr:tetratricopeptide repeat-containing serine protease family protein [Verrucomicrobiae bacterium]